MTNFKTISKVKLQEKNGILLKDCQLGELTEGEKLFSYESDQSNEYDISEMKEDKTYYCQCPYCGEEEPNGKYKVGEKEYPFSTNVQSMNLAYAICHYGVNMWWTDIHCCPNCKKEYYTVHEH